MYDRNIVGPFSEVFGNLRPSSENVRKRSRDLQNIDIKMIIVDMEFLFSRSMLFRVIPYLRALMHYSLFISKTLRKCKVETISQEISEDSPKVVRRPDEDFGTFTKITDR